MKTIIKQAFRSLLVISSVTIWIGCNSKTSNQTETFGYTQEQLETLNASSSTNLRVDCSDITKIDLNNLFDKEINNVEIIKKINIVELESTDESLVGNINNIIITDSRIYIKDDFLQSGVIIFDRDGKFIRRIKNGNGPGEIYMAAAFDYDYSKNELVVCQNRCMYYYNKDGEFLYDKPTPFGAHDFKIYNELYAFETLNPINPQMQSIAENMFFQTDTTFRMISSGLPCIKFLGFSSPHYLSENGGELFIPQNFNDTIYALNGNKLLAKYVLNYSDKKVPQNVLDKSNTFPEFYENINNSDYCFFLGDYREAGNIQEIRLSHFTRGDFLAYRDKKTGHIIGGFRSNFDATQFPMLNLPFATHKDYFVTTITNFEYSEYCKDSKILSKEDIAKILRHKEDDNALIALYKVEL